MAWWLHGALLLLAGGAPRETIEQALEVAPVWAGHPVGFCLLTVGGKQFVAYYDAERQMTVAERRLDSETWTITRLPSQVGWDSHNYLTLVADDEGLLHLAGNMHAVPLIYFRSAAPYDSTTLSRVASMVGNREQKVTYPVFFRGPDNALLFTYRDGSSGNGDQIYNVWDAGTHTWRRLLDRELVSGEGERNAYLHGPVHGPDGLWHLVWVWRETPDCATNHDPSYARSPDLVHWTRSDGTPLELPITLATGEIVDAIPVGGGVINGNVVLGFDAERRPIVSYHKYDANGFLQIFNARLENGAWQRHQATEWDYRWEFSGGGSIPFEVRVGSVSVAADGSLRQSFGHPKAGSGVWRLDPATLRPVEVLPPADPTPPELRRVTSDYPGMRVQLRGDSGSSGEPGVRYLLRWETLGANRDRPRDEAPPPSPLRLYKLRQSAP